MGSKELEQLLSDLREWCSVRGRQRELADLLGFKKQLVSHWINGRRIPTLEDGLKIQAFLKKQKSRRKSTR
jgi:DNA-binding transcriptional regulator YdaS (Cro superfamily)